MTERTVKTSLIAQANQYISEMGKAADATRRVRDEQETLAAKSRAFEQVGRAAFTVGAIAAAGIALAVKTFADFDQAMSNVGAATMESADNLALLRQAAIDFGAESVFTATAAAGAIEELGKAGLSTADILEGGLASSLSLAASSGLEIARAAEIAATTMSQFSIDGSDAARVADILAAGAGKALGSVDDLAQGLKFVGPVAAQMGVSLEETTGVLALFAQQGVIGEQAGTSLRGIISSLTSPSKQAAKEIEKLGITLYDSQGNFLGLENAAGQLSDAYSGMKDEARDFSLGILFGNEQITAARLLYDAGAEGVRKWTGDVQEAGYAARVAAMRLDNLNGDLEGFGGAVESAVLGSGAAANEVLRELVQGATFLVSAVGDLPEPVLEGGLALGTMGASTALAAGAALTAIPKFVEMRESLKALGLAGRSAALGVVGVGAALGLAAIALSAFVSEQAASKARTEGFTDSLDQATGAVTKYTRELVVKRLQEAGAFEDAKRYGISQRELTDAVIEGGDALDDVKEKLAATSEGLTGQQRRGVALEAQYGATARAIQGTSGELENAREAFRNAEAATEDNEAALQGMQEATADAEQAVQDLSDTLSNFGKVDLDARAAVRELESAIDEATAAFEENGATLDIGAEAGRNNQAALDGIARAANDAAAAIYDQTGSIEEASVALDNGRQKYIEVGVQMGLTAEQAEDYADQLIATPAAIQTQVILTGVEQARARLAGLASAYKVGGSVSLRAVVEADARPNATGNLYSYADGGFGEGIYSGGTPLYKFAEPETRWEALISGRVGAEARNREIWAEAGQRLGVSPAVSQTQTVIERVAETVQLVLPDGRVIAETIREFDRSLK